MNTQELLIGGIAPAVLLGVGTVLMRFSIGAGASVPVYLAVVGTMIALIGWVAVLVSGQGHGGWRSIGAAMAMATTWSGAIACMAYGLGTLRLPVSVIAPLTNSNALVAVALGALVFGEWRELHMWQAGLGTLLICAGAMLVSISR